MTIGPKVVVFDVNETLLDVRALAPRFDELLGDHALLGPWFGQMLRNSLVATTTSAYRPFAEQGTDALVTVAARAGIDVTWNDAATVVAGMAELPPHPDVIAGLGVLRTAGFDLVTLTNSAPDMVAAQIDHAGLAPYFSALHSVEPTGRFKPHPAPYLAVAHEVGVEPGALWMVAAHDWDVTGAMRVGMRGAFVARPGQHYSSLGEPPDVTGPDLVAVADAVVAFEGQSA